MAQPSTQSEALFEELCQHNGISYARLPVQPDSKQPDYELEVAGHRLVCEVKQIDPNEEDQQFATELQIKGTASQCRNPDVMAKRVRNQIKKSRSQFKAYFKRHSQTPAVLVLFDAAKNSYTEPYTIQTALHGWEQVLFRVSANGEPPIAVDRGFTHRNNRELRSDRNDHLSALATLHECWHFDTHERFLALSFYHNQYAAHPIVPAWWSGPHISHFVMSEKVVGQYQNWTDIAAQPHSDE